MAGDKEFPEGSRTLTRADLANAVYAAVGLSRAEAAEIVDSVLDAISEAVINGRNVKLSSFGTFTIRHKRERLGRNPKTGKETPISERRVISFKASHIMKSRLNRALNGAGD
jgi:integration host factor subunit alpha